ncbi:MAG: AAA family ATPase, partial [Hyphomonadaceae bacterium]|nr:AAA family ATPase [Clostridia bacterium]
MAELIGIVEDVIYANEQNGYTVCEICAEDNSSAIAVGIMPLITPGESVHLRGQWVQHQEYGEQFKVESLEKAMPCTLEMIEKYLSSGIIKGIRASSAKKIVAHFGEKAIEILETQPQRLSEIKGISKKKAAEIGEAFMAQHEMRKVIMFLQQYGVTTNFSMKIFKHFGQDAIDKIKQNPYVLADEIEGIGFRTADKIAFNMGMNPHAADRVKSAVKYVLEQQLSAGHSYLPKPLLIGKLMDLIGIVEQEADNAITDLWISKKIMLETKGEEQRVYLPAFYQAELSVARRLLRLSMHEPSFQWVAEGSDIDLVEQETGITLADKQREAVTDALQHGVVVITGGPGTGKTTIINTIIRIFEKKGLEIALTAPTGRAAKRMTEMTGQEAKTAHRLLEMGYSGESHTMVFGKDENMPLEYDAIIVDEMSMVDILLMNALLKAIVPGTRLILVGDADQLPSVGAGNVLKDILKSKMIRMVRLTEIFRQAQESMIIVNAHKINRGEMPILNAKQKDFFFMPRESQNDVVDTILSLLKDRLPKFLDNASTHSIQVLTPVRKS